MIDAFGDDIVTHARTGLRVILFAYFTFSTQGKVNIASFQNLPLNRSKLFHENAVLVEIV